MALTCSDCGTRIELPIEERRRLAGKFFACPECGASRKLPPAPVEPASSNPFAFIEQEATSHAVRQEPSPLSMLTDDPCDVPNNEILFKKSLIALFGFAAFVFVVVVSHVIALLKGNSDRAGLPVAIAGLFLAAIPAVYAYRIYRSLSGEFGMTFRNPANQFAVKCDDPFVMSLWLGCFYYVYHEAWAMFAITALVIVCGCGVPWLILPWFAPHLLRRHYMMRGYQQTYGPEA